MPNRARKIAGAILRQHTQVKRPWGLTAPPSEVGNKIAMALAAEIEREYIATGRVAFHPCVLQDWAREPKRRFGMAALESIRLVNRGKRAASDKKRREAAAARRKKTRSTMSRMLGAGKKIAQRVTAKLFRKAARGQ